MDERPAPLLTHDVWTDDDIAELARHAVRQRAEPVDREGERIGRLVHPEMLALQGAALGRAYEGESELARCHAFTRQHGLRELGRGRLVHLPARAVDDLDPNGQQ